MKPSRVLLTILLTVIVLSALLLVCAGAVSLLLQINGIKQYIRESDSLARLGFSELSELNDHSELDIESIPRELIRMADERMYHRKQLMKSK